MNAGVSIAKYRQEDEILSDMKLSKIERERVDNRNMRDLWSDWRRSTLLVFVKRSVRIANLVFTYNVLDIIYCMEIDRLLFNITLIYFQPLY